MIAKSIDYKNGYWYLTASVFCELREFRRPGGATEDDWEEYKVLPDCWDFTCFQGYAEDLLQAYIKNGGKIKQLFIKE